jgi:hypothetical protein
MEERMTKLGGKLTYANVMATIAVFIALGGVGYAATKLPKNSVGAKQLKKKSVTTAKIKNNAVTTAKLKDNAVTTPKIKDDSVNGAKVADGSLTGADIKGESLGAAQINQASLTVVRAGNVMSMAFSGDGNCTPVFPPPPGVSSKHQAKGNCKITFPKAVNNCAASATPRTHNIPGIIILAQHTVEALDFAEDPRSIQVNSWREGALADHGFDLVVVC